MSERHRLDAALEGVASTAGGPADLRSTLVRITDIACDSVPGVDFASITVRHRAGRLETVAPSSPLMHVADGLQYELNQGPCYDAVTHDGVVYCSDLAHDSRWPEFGPKAAMLGLSALLAIRLEHQGEAFMSLNLYSDTVGAFADYHRVAQMFMSRPAGGADPGEQGRTLQVELANRTVVEHATGILMFKHGVNAEEALELLSTLAEQRRADPDA